MEGNNDNSLSSQKETDLRRGPWMVDEDLTLINHIATNGEGRWNSLARSAGLKRTGKSCRLRWLNYLRPNVRRGNITLEEQLLILELHCCWGNRWSKIAQYLPGRTDNEIKNYWRTRVKKHAKQLKCDVNSKQFKDTMRYLWMPRLVERIQAATTAPTTFSGSYNTGWPTPTGQGHSSNLNQPLNFTPENSANSSSVCLGSAQVSDLADNYYSLPITSQDTNVNDVDCYNFNNNQRMDYQDVGGSNIQQNAHQQWYVGDTTDNLWNVEDIYVFQHNLNM